ncbi:MAG: RNA methyltransferase [Gallionella sp.]
MKHIHSRNNPFFKDLIKLSSNTRSRNKAGQTLLDGTHLLAAYLEAGYKPQHLLLNEAALRHDEITGLLTRINEVSITVLDDKLFKELSDLKTTTGLLALITLPQAKLSPAEYHFTLLLEGIQDPGNLGSILRTAAAAGCEAVCLSADCADVWSPKVLRAAMGGHFCLDIREKQDLLAVADHFPGIKLALSLQAAASLYECDLTGNIAFMMGNEGAGLSIALQKKATQRILIPMSAGVESLNVGTATAICLFEAVRQRINFTAK